MTTTTTPSRWEGQGVVAVKAPALAWAIRRTLLAIVILLVSIAGAAFLLYASIDPGEEGWPAAEPQERVDLSRADAAGPGLILEGQPIFQGRPGHRVQWSRGPGNAGLRHR